MERLFGFSKLRKLKFNWIDYGDSYNPISSFLELQKHFPALEELSFAEKYGLDEPLEDYFLKNFPTGLTRLHVGHRPLDAATLSLLPSSILDLQIKTLNLPQAKKTPKFDEKTENSDSSATQEPLRFPPQLTRLHIQQVIQTLPIYASLPPSVTDISISTFPKKEINPCWELLPRNLLYFSANLVTLTAHLASLLPPRLLSLALEYSDFKISAEILRCLPSTLLYLSLESEESFERNVSADYFNDWLAALPPRLTGLNFPFPGRIDDRFSLPTLSLNICEKSISHYIEEALKSPMEALENEKNGKDLLRVGFFSKTNLKDSTSDIKMDVSESNAAGAYWIVPERFQVVEVTAYDSSPSMLFSVTPRAKFLYLVSGGDEDVPASHPEWALARKHIQTGLPRLKSLCSLSRAPQLQGLLDYINSPIDHLQFSLPLISKNRNFPPTLTSLMLLNCEATSPILPMDLILSLPPGLQNLSFAALGKENNFASQFLRFRPCLEV